MSDKILVPYATEAGPTVDVDEAIAEQLRCAGAAVEVHPADDVKNPDA